MTSTINAEGATSLVFAVNELPGATGLGLTKINELIGSGAIPARKAGRRTLVLRADIDAFLRNLPRVVAL